VAGGIEIRGANQLATMAKRFKAQGRAGVTRQMVADIRREVKPIQAAQKRAVRGLAHAPSDWKKEAARAAKIRVTTRSRSAAVRLTVSGKGQYPRRARLLNRGRWRHPLFGDRERWFTQTVTPGWFDVPARKGEYVIRGRVKAVIERYIRRLEGR
jgi:hypothetical protein